MRFSVDARTILRLGRDSIRDNTTAVIELVKNSYDAGARNVEVEIYVNNSNPFIRIADNGDGMTPKELESNWLRIGFSRKASERYSKDNRRRTGEKGIGRISADRLGAELHLLTRPQNAKAHGLLVEWDKFDVDETNLNDIEIPNLDATDIRLPLKDAATPKSGTELRIYHLRQSWSEKDIEALYSELALLVSPFQVNTGFTINLASDAWKKGSIKVESQVPMQANLDFTASFDGKELTYQISQRSLRTKKQIFNKTLEWNEFIQQVGEDESPSNVAIGPVNIRLLFFVKKTDPLSPENFSLKNINRFLDKNVGVRIYRDQVLVKPYGDPKDSHGDWLGLSERKTGDPAGVGRRSYKIAAKQLVGAVFVGRDSNPRLIDSSSREGLVNNPEFYRLKTLLLGCVRLLELYRHETYTAEKTRSVNDIARESVGLAASQIETFKEELHTIATQLDPKVARSFEKYVNEQTTAILENIAKTGKSVDELINQAALYRGLATIGIASAVFGHETQSAIDEFKMAAGAAQAQLGAKPPRVTTAILELQKAIRYSGRVAAWGAFALARVQYEKRKKRERDLKGLCDELMQNVGPIFSSSNIELISDFKSVRAKVFDMDIEAIILNLLANAYHACQLEKRPRKIKIEVGGSTVSGKKGFHIIVGDTGTGVPEDFRQRIWEPLFSTKLDTHGKQIGTGLGLTIVKSIVDGFYGTVNVATDSELKGARFEIWVPI